MPENHSGNGRLDSWKEIADYLKRDTRTAIRWEERGLPVHRVPGGKRQAVFAYQEEIDAWLGSEGDNGAEHFFPEKNPQPKSNGHESSGNVESQAAEPNSRAAAESATTSNPATLLQRRTPLIAIVCLLITGLGGWFVWRPNTTKLRVASLKQLTDDGRVKGTLRSDGTRLYFTEAEGARYILVSAPVSGSPIRPIETPFTNVSLQDLSNDGKTLLFLSYEGITMEGPLWAIPTQGGKPRRISEAACNFARWSPDNGKIACAHGTTITVMNADGGDVRTAGAFSFPVGPVVWMPDGQHLRFVLEDAPNHTTSQWEMGLSEGGSIAQAQRLSLGPHCCTDWTWTRDRKSFVYAEIDELGKSHLRVQTSISSRPYELPVNIGTLWTAAPATDRSSLFLTISGAYRGELLKFDSKQKTLQTFLPGLSAAFMAFSGDGQWITYANTLDNTLWRSRVDGSEALQLTTSPMLVEVSSWSPDGQTIAFMACSPGKPWRIYLIDRNGGPMLQAGEGTDSQGGPSWSPDGKLIVYGNVDCEKTQNCWIRRLELASGKAEIIPGSSGLRTARWSPDGKYIAALQFQTHELMLFDLRGHGWRSLAGSVNGDNVNWSSDSQYIYVDSPRDMKPVIERVRVSDGQRETAVSLKSLQRVPGTTNGWFGLAPDNAPILSHLFTGAEVYELKWTEQ